MKPTLILIAGFLGAGKTTLLLAAAKLLSACGHRVGVVTNDQGGALVDTRYASASGTPVQEVAGGCFCCRFSGLMSAAERLLAHGPDIILAEPVGSCIDLAATVLRPLRHFHGDRYRTAPLTVLIDPQTAQDLLAPAADPHLAYLFRRQLEEADLLCFSKSDLHQEIPQLPGRVASRLSAATGEGVAEWLQTVLADVPDAGGRGLDVDYQRYAEAEAALGWLNWHGIVQLGDDWLSAPQIAGPLLDDIDQALTRAGVRILHLKLFDETREGYVKASICRNGEEPLLDGDLAQSPACRHEVVLNLRALASPELLRTVVEQALDRLPGERQTVQLHSFRPAPPQPEHRIGA